jgi:transcriptional regulator of acetoin/glycerol metabolism
VAGHPALRERAAAEHTVMVGVQLAESVAGTNGVGTTLFLGASSQVCSAEHYCEVLQDWTCAAAPIRDPVTGGVLGVVDVTHPSDPETAALPIADSLARMFGEIRLEVGSERLRVIHHHVEVAASYPSVEVLAYDRFGVLIGSSRAGAPGGRRESEFDGAPSASGRPICDPRGEESIGTLVVRPYKGPRRYSIPEAEP